MNINKKILVSIATFIQGKKIRDLNRNSRQTRIYTDKLIIRSLNQYGKKH